jgi:molecular chaperone GrpE
MAGTKKREASKQTEKLNDQIEIPDKEEIASGNEKTVEIEEPVELSIADKMEQLEREKAEFKDKWIRSVAEFDNYRRRSNTEKSTWIKNANQRLILELCDVNDNFERAIAADNSQKDAGNFLKGIELIFKQIGNILKREGVEKVITEKKTFDPEFHEALAHIPSNLGENKIAATIQNGYLMNGKLIRAAQVAVSNGEKPVEAVAQKTDKKKRKK